MASSAGLRVYRGGCQTQGTQFSTCGVAAVGVVGRALKQPVEVVSASDRLILPHNKTLARVAATAAIDRVIASGRIVVGHLCIRARDSHRDVSVLGLLPLLIATVTQRLAVARAADFSRQTYARRLIRRQHIVPGMAH